MCKNELFQSLETKNELFKIQGRKTNFMQSLGINNSLPLDLTIKNWFFILSKKIDIFIFII